MFSVLALSVLLAAHGASPADNPSATPIPAPTPLYQAFASVTLGDSPAAVRKELGKPLEIDPVNIGEMWRYNADGGNARLAVIFASGAALSVTLSVRDNKKSSFADPYGAVLGMTVDQLTSMRGQPVTVSDNGNRAYGDLAGVRWVYGFDGGLMTDINLSQPLRSSASAPAPSAIDLTDGHDGSSVEHAIILNAASTAAGSKLESQYIVGLTCGQSGTWAIVAQTTVPAGAKWFDQFTLSCSTDKSAQTLYFDVTSYAGK